MIYFITLEYAQAKVEVLSTIFVFDPNFKLVADGSLTTLWIDTTMRAEDIYQLQGVDSVISSILNNV